jgi:hypothetical protein
MLIAQAEGLHPAVAARDYHIIDGRPCLKADAMLSRFQNRGGVVQWDDLTDTRAVGIFSHPQSCPKPVCIEWTIDRAKKAEVYREKTSSGKTGMWIKYPRQMLRARVISEGVRTVYPLACNGMYVPEEVQDFEDDKSRPAARETTAEVVPTPTIESTPAPQPATAQSVDADTPTTAESAIKTGTPLTDVQKMELTAACKEKGLRTGEVKAWSRDFLQSEVCAEIYDKLLQQIKTGPKAIRDALPF